MRVELRERHTQLRFDIARRDTGLSVLLVSMPMAHAIRPSIQLGILAEAGRRAGHQVSTLHANLDFARSVIDLFEPETDADAMVERLLNGRDRYSMLADIRALLGDWLFSIAAFGDDAPDAAAEYVLADPTIFDGLPFDAQTVLQIRDQLVPAFLDGLMRQVDWRAYDLIGFSSTFQQQVPSLALSRRLATEHPHLVQLFGGANVDAEMGVAQLSSNPSMDLVLRGEADRSFVELLDGLAGGRDLSNIPGIVGRVGSDVVIGPDPAPTTQMDDVPLPDYREFFQRADALGLIPSRAASLVTVPFESARGCWWGAKRHCTFCGLNGSTMEFRSKSPARVKADLDELAKRHQTFRFDAVDNILDNAYHDTLLADLASSGSTFELFYEVKADLDATDLGKLRRAGVKHIQPGIESLSSRVLGLMRKGTRASWNVNVLRWARYYGISVSWNVLWGFPGESVQDYAEQAQAIPHLVHLQPPGGFDQIWLERFSPLFRHGDELGVDTIAPVDAYRYVYPATHDIDGLAYFFAYTSESTVDEADTAGLREAIESWQARHRQSPAPTLVRYKAPSFIRIVDNRDPSASGAHVLDGPAAMLHEACMYKPRKAADIAEELAVPAEAVATVLDSFVERGLVFKDGALYLSLAVPPSPYA